MNTSQDVLLLHLWRGDFDVDDDGSQRRLEELRRVVDGVCVQDNQLEGLGQLKDPLDLTLDLGCRAGQWQADRQTGGVFTCSSAASFQLMADLT